MRPYSVLFCKTYHPVFRMCFKQILALTLRMWYITERRYDSTLVLTAVK